jgi:DNA helicase-2/ATP-dependent DNA helicase PcrA
MITLTDEQVNASAALDRLVNIVSAPGSGKTTIAAERFGFKRYERGDRRGVLGLSFTRAAVGELRSRIEGRWGSRCLAFPHHVSTFDELYVRLIQGLIDESKIRWPNGQAKLEVIDDYRGYSGHRWLTTSSFERYATLSSDGRVVSAGRPVERAGAGIGTVDRHQAVLDQGIVSHGDVRSILTRALLVEELQAWISNWMECNYRDIIIDEIYDAAALDLNLALIAARAGSGLTLIGDPRQALYGWRGATPDQVQTLLALAPEPFVSFEQSRSFRFVGAQMPELASNLRAGLPVQLPGISCTEVDVALGRRWRSLWSAGDNILPLAFRNISNATDGAINLLLDLVTRAHLGRNSYGKEAAVAQLGLDREDLALRQEAVLGPLLRALSAGADPAQVLSDLRDAIVSLGGSRRPTRLAAANELIRVEDIRMLAIRLVGERLIPGLTVYQAKGQEWPRVGVVLSGNDTDLLSQGLRELEDDDCVIYVALTRAKEKCGRLGSDLQLEI